MTSSANNTLDVDSRFRIGWAEAAIYALDHCDPKQGAAICATYLEQVETGGPYQDAFGHLYQDARFWAEAAPPHEVVAYTIAGLRQFPAAHIGIIARKRAFAALWERFSESDRIAFLRRVDAEGNFHRGAA